MKNLLKTKRTSGFTIIEVMIVLAIAGLIMVIVFIAVPQLQRNQRDNSRQNIANRVKAEIENYAGNNQGRYPFTAAGTGTGTWADFVTKYIDDPSANATCNNAGEKVNTCDPTLAVPIVGTGALGAQAANERGTPVAFNTAPCDDDLTGIRAGDFHVCFGARCNGENTQASGAATVDTRTFAVVVGLDRNDTAYCVDNG